MQRRTPTAEYHHRCCANRRCTMSLAAIIPIAVLILAFVIYCWVDIARGEVQHLPKWAWALIVAASVPLGGIVYFIIGRVPRPRSHTR